MIERGEGKSWCGGRTGGRRYFVPGSRRVDLEGVKEYTQIILQVRTWAKGIIATAGVI